MSHKKSQNDYKEYHYAVRCPVAKVCADDCRQLTPLTTGDVDTTPRLTQKRKHKIQSVCPENRHTFRDYRNARDADPAMDRFLDRYPIGEDIQRVMTAGGMWVIVIAVIAMLVVSDYCFRNTSFVKGINISIIRIWDGFKVLFHMKGTGLYLILTLGIWICYFFEAYVCFFAFPFTRELVTHSAYPLGLVPGLVVFVFGSCSMAVPSNGGLGPWNIAVMFALSLFGISDSDGAAYSIVCWSFQAIILVTTGIFGAFYIMASRRNVKRRKAGIRNNQ